MVRGGTVRSYNRDISNNNNEHIIGDDIVIYFLGHNKY